MKGIAQTIVLIAAIWGIALVADQIAPLTQLTSYLIEHPQPYTAITIAMGVVGFGLCVLGWVIFGAVSSHRMTDEEARGYIRMRRGMRVGAFRGKAAGVTGENEMSFAAIKEALRSGGWRDASVWPFLLGLIGVPLALCGIFGYFFVIGAPTIKLIVGAALVYAVVRFTWAWWQA